MCRSKTVSSKILIVSLFLGVSGLALQAQPLILNVSGQTDCSTLGIGSSSGTETFTARLVLDRRIVHPGDIVNGSYTSTRTGPCTSLLTPAQDQLGTIVIPIVSETPLSPGADTFFFDFLGGTGANYPDFWSVTDFTGVHNNFDLFVAGSFQLGSTFAPPCHGILSGQQATFNCSFTWEPASFTLCSEIHSAACPSDLTPPYRTFVDVDSSGTGSGFFLAARNPIPDTFPSQLNSTSTILLVAEDNSSDLGRSCGAGTCGSPINLTNGNTWIQHQDYALPGLGGGLGLVRTWNSIWSTQVPPAQSGMFGDSWTSTYEERLQILPNPPSNTQVKYWRGDGSAWTFAQDPSTGGYSLISPPDEHARLVFDTATTLFTLTQKDGTQEIFNNPGFLVALIDRNGNKTTPSYASSGRLAKVTDAASRSLVFNYGNPAQPALVTSIQDAVRTVATYAYNSSGHLISVTYADGSMIHYNSDSSGLITSTTDANGKLLEAHSYDAFRRGLTSGRGNGADALTVSYASGMAVLTDSLGRTSQYAKTRIGGRNFISSTSGPGCASCGGRGNYSYVYDSSGNQTSVTDPLGNVTNFTYDALGNVLTRSAKLANGTAQTWSYTYNTFSQVTSSTDPLGNTTIFQYDSKGNLTSVISPPPQ